MSEEDKEHHGEKHHTEEKSYVHEKPKKEGILTINKMTIWQAVSAILGILLIISIYTGGFRGDGSDEGVEDTKPTQEEGTDIAALMDDDSVKGDKNAPVTIVEWSDYECPYCVTFYKQTFGQIDKEYIETGKVKFVYRDFPLNFHKNAQKAAEAAECAGEQDKYYEMHDKLFEGGVSRGVSSFKQYAKDIGLDTSDFNECLDSGKMASEVRKDMSDGQKAGVRGTPAFIINGQLVSGAQPFENFRKIIDAELAK